VLIAATLGTLFEWYDFFLYGTLASVFSRQFFSGVSESTAFIYALLAFGVGFASRPVGALIFGRLGDMLGRKYTFLATLLLMGGSTLAVGFLPSYQTLGVAAPAILICLRVLQGIGIGGEYGGAAIFVAEHAPSNKRGAYTSWIQTTGGIGMILALVVVFICRYFIGQSFETWGWRVPFILSGGLLAMSLYIRLSVSESPLFLKMKAEGKTSKAPLRETFGQWKNVKTALVAMFGLVTGMTTVLYTAQIYVLFFLTHSLRLAESTATIYVVVILALSMPLYWVVGVVSDKIGRKPIILTGCLVAALTIFPMFHAITHYANPALEAASSAYPVTVVADTRTCSLQFDPIGKKQFTSDCDRIRLLLTKVGIPYSNEVAAAGATTMVEIGNNRLAGFDPVVLKNALQQAGYRETADLAQVNKPMLFLLIFLLCVLMAMTYAPMAAALVEMFPARIRYTALSFPYQLGTGLVGGFFPTVSFAIVAETGNIYAGLWYPAFFAMLTAVVGFLFLPRENVGEEPAADGAPLRQGTTNTG
jgi:MFS family permease